VVTVAAMVVSKGMVTAVAAKAGVAVAEMVMVAYKGVVATVAATVVAMAFWVLSSYVCGGCGGSGSGASHRRQNRIC